MRTCAIAPDLAPLNRGGVAGARLGGTFSLTRVTALDHSADPRVAGKLTAFTQGGGFSVAASALLIAAHRRDRARLAAASAPRGSC